MLNQNSNCTISGIDRNAQIYTQAITCSTGLCDRRLTASTTPSANPRTVPHSVSFTVIHSACSTEPAVKYLANVAQSHPGLVARPWTNCASSTRTTTLTTHRHGCHLRATSSAASSGRSPTPECAESRGAADRARTGALTFAHHLEQTSLRRPF